MPMPRTTTHPTAEHARLAESNTMNAPWRRWGPYLSERQWGTVREDYSHDGDCWNSFPHDHARSRAYRWGEDGLLGISDDQGFLCFALALWNGKDPILKERLFGLTGPEGNHGEDVKEHYFYLDSTPTHSYMKALYKYPLAEFPYERLVRENASRGRDVPEFELTDTGVLNDARYVDVQAEYAKAGPDDILILLTLTNRAAQAAELHVLPTLWFRNTWSWGTPGAPPRPSIAAHADDCLRAHHTVLGQHDLWFASDDAPRPTTLFTENDTNATRLWGAPNPVPHTKDAFHEHVVNGRTDATNPGRTGTKAAPWFRLLIAPGASATIRLRLTGSRDADATAANPFDEFESILATRRREADAFYDALGQNRLDAPAARAWRQAFAGLLWSKQFYHYWVPEWLDGDPAGPTPPPQRHLGRNAKWRHLNNADVISMPDKWEYPWYAAWDLAFHAVALAQADPDFAKHQLILLLREWYMHPSGQIPAYEFALDDVNPPVHAWACWRVYKMTAPRGERDRTFLKRTFMKLLLNFTWWVNRKDPDGNNVFAGGFLGLDNIGAFDRSRPLPTGGHLQQADGTAWMAFYCGTMLSIALELADEDPAYEDIATKFFEHFVAIIDAINTRGGTGLWDPQDAFYYDKLNTDGRSEPLRVRSLVGLVPLIACEILEEATLERLPDFKARLEWFVANRPDLACHIIASPRPEHPHRLLAIPDTDRLRKSLAYLLDESEFLSPFGIRSVSKVHHDSPFVLHAAGQTHSVEYTPGESTTAMFGGNSNWRGPIWVPLNYLIIETLERYHHFYADSFTIECPTGSGRHLTLAQAAHELRRRLAALVLPDDQGRIPALRADPLFASDPAFADLLLFHEHFHPDTGRGLGATHQTGWTALLAPIIADCHASCPSPPPRNPDSHAVQRHNTGPTPPPHSRPLPHGRQTCPTRLAGCDQPRAAARGRT